MFSVHTTPEEFGNGGFTLKTYQMFSVRTMPENFENVEVSILKQIKSFPFTLPTP